MIYSKLVCLVPILEKQGTNFPNDIRLKISKFEENDHFQIMGEERRVNKCRAFQNPTQFPETYPERRFVAVERAFGAGICRQSRIEHRVF